MENKPYLIFNLSRSLYGIKVTCVQEILPLPELTPVSEAPRDIVGVVNLRGEILPVMDLNLRLGYRQRQYLLTDSVVIVEWQNIRVGLIVEKVHEVENISQENIKTELFGKRDATNHSPQFVVGIAQMGADIVMLLNLETLTDYSKSVIPLIVNNLQENLVADETNTRIPDHFYSEQPVFAPHATPEERAIFRQRAENLIRSVEEDMSGMIPLAIIGLNKEYFGLDLELVREFTDIRKITPVPCCPDYIIGNMNLRGEILTLIDIRRALKMPINPEKRTTKVMVIQVNDVVAGVTIEQIFDVTYLHPSQIVPVPAAVHSVSDEYLRGTAPYRETMMSILDLAKLLIQGDLIVNEEV